MNTIDLKQNNYKDFLFDLIIYISIMFLVREIYFPTVEFIANGLFWSFSTLVVATWRMKARGISWYDLGLRKPKSIKKTILVAGLILLSIPVSIMIFNIINDQFSFLLKPDTSETSAVSKFGNLKGNWRLFLSIMPFILLQSMLEELLDRGFLINWFERLFSKSNFATIFAVITQAAIFGFRHSYDISERSITVFIIGLIMGIGYVAFGRNLWPPIIAHCALNTITMIGRV